MTARLTIPETAAAKALVAALCSYEVGAIASRGRVPTITALHRRHPAVGVAIVGALAVHFWVSD